MKTPTVNSMQTDDTHSLWWIVLLDILLLNLYQKTLKLIM